MKKITGALLLMCLITVGTTFSANEANNKYYPTQGKYAAIPGQHWYNSSHVMDTTQGFKYGATPGGGDYDAVKHAKYKSGDNVIAVVKNADGKTSSGPSAKTSYAQIGALRGTDYHKMID